MRQFLSTSFIALTLLISAAGAAPAAHAQTCPPGQDYDANDGCQPIQTGPESCKYGYTYDANAGCIPAETTAGTPIDPSTAKMSTPPAAAMDMTGGFGSVMVWIMSLFAWLLGVAALTLNYAVYYTVVTMGSYIHDIAAIGVTWRILRDIGNIVFIFGFLGIGISVILNVDWYGGKTKMLPMLLIGAIFLNFSLFITEAVIDVGNLFATQFYTQIVGGTLPTQQALAATTVGTFGSGNLGNEGISNKLMGQLGLQTIYNAGRVNQAAYKNGNTWTIGFMGIILFITAAFVMFSLAFILITRFVYLIFLIILAPIGFAGLAIPKMKATADWWWHSLFQQTITAPVLLLLLYIALAVITDVKFLSLGTSGTLSWTGFIDGTNGTNLPGFAGLILTFLVAMGLLLYCVIAAKQLGAVGAAGATKLASKLSGVGIAAAAPGWVGRHTVGLGARYTAKKLRDTPFGRSFVGRGIASTLEKKVAGASFDLRNTGVGKSASGIGLDLGEGQTGGYNKDFENRVKAYEDAAAGITGDKKETAEEKKKHREAEGATEAAQVTLKQAKAEAEETETRLRPQINQETAERDRLAALATSNRNSGIFDKKVTDDLAAAEKKLAASNATLSVAMNKYTAADVDLRGKDGKGGKIKAEKDAKANIGTAKKEAQVAYGKRLERNWGRVWVFGSAAAEAGPRIKADAGKSKKQKAMEDWMVATQGVAGGAPAAPAPAATPSPAGGGGGGGAAAGGGSGARP